MSTIHLISPDGVQSTHDEEELRSMWADGLLLEGTQYWREGMPEWRPITEWLAGNSVSSRSGESAVSARNYSYARDPRSLTSFLVVMLWISLGMGLVSILSDFAQLSLLNRPYTEAEALANDDRQTLIGTAGLLVFIVTGITFLRWTYRANLNCRGFGARDMRFTPGWSVGYYFIPIVNLFKPYQAMKEIWQVSHDPVDWKSVTAGGWVDLWWGLWILSAIANQVAFRVLMRAETVEALRTGTMFSLLAEIITIPLCLAALYVIKSISAKQDQLVGGVYGVVE